MYTGTYREIYGMYKYHWIRRKSFVFYQPLCRNIRGVLYRQGARLQRATQKELGEASTERTNAYRGKQYCMKNKSVRRVGMQKYCFRVQNPGQKGHTSLQVLSRLSVESAGAVLLFADLPCIYNGPATTQTIAFYTVPSTGNVELD